MKTHEEIKKALVYCNTFNNCQNCPYDKDGEGWGCVVERNADALAYIQQLENHIGELTEKVEQLRAEQQNLICDFMDYINDGVQNPALYCAFGKSCVLVDKRGWCRPGEHGCNGFVPKVRDDDENA